MPAKSNLRTRNLVYLSNADIFRYIENHPFQCVQVVTYQTKEPAMIEPDNAKDAKRKEETEIHFDEIIRTVHFWNCDDFEDGAFIQTSNNPGH
jgi:hypothetical protein